MCSYVSCSFVATSPFLFTSARKRSQYMSQGRYSVLSLFGIFLISHPERLSVPIWNRIENGRMTTHIHASRGQEKEPRYCPCIQNGLLRKTVIVLCIVCDGVESINQYAWRDHLLFYCVMCCCIHNAAVDVP